MTIRAPHVVMLPGPHFGGKCLHCGRSAAIVTPVEVMDACAMIRAFVDRHEDCPPPTKAEDPTGTGT